MMTKENQRVALTRRLLQEGLLSLLEHKPMDKISVTELCSASGINRSTFYNHFNSPRDVLLDVENRLTRDLMDITAKHSPNLSTIECLEDICAYMHDHRKIATILVSFNADTDLKDVFRRIDSHYLNTHGQPLSKMTPDERHLVSSFVCTGCYYMIREWIIRDINKSPREVAELAYRFFSTAHKMGGTKQ